MYKVAVVGDKQSIMGFAALGLEIHPVDTAEEAVKTVHTLASSYGVIYITEDLAESIEEDIRRYSGDQTPSIIPIPGVTGSTGYGLRRVKDATIKAIGSDILADSEN